MVHDHPPIDGDLKGYLSGRSTRTFQTPSSYGAETQQHQDSLLANRHGKNIIKMEAGEGVWHVLPGGP